MIVLLIILAGIHIAMVHVSTASACNAHGAHSAKIFWKLLAFHREVVHQAKGLLGVRLGHIMILQTLTITAEETDQQ